MTGLHDLTLSANPGITPHGWSKLFIAMGASHTLRNLHMDYNNVMDYGVGCLAVALAATKTVHTVDLEGSGITELGAQVRVQVSSHSLIPLYHLQLGQRFLINWITGIFLQQLGRRRE